MALEQSLFLEEQENLLYQSPLEILPLEKSVAPCSGYSSMAAV